MVKVHMMKAYEGDFIWLSYGDSEKEYHLLIDGGIKECRERYADVIRSISAKGESIEAIILTHIDCDHIAGACEGIAKIDAEVLQTSVYKGYKRDKIEMRVDRVEVSDFPLYLNTVAGGLDRRDQTIGGFSFVVKIYAVPVVEIIGQLLYLLGRYGFNAQFSDCL